MAKKAKLKASKKAAKGKKSAKKAAKRAVTKAVKRTPKRAAKKAAKKPGKRPAKKAPTKVAAKATSKPAAKRAAKGAAKAKRAPARTTASVGKRPNLDRERRTIREEEEMVPSPPSSLNMDRTASAARSGRHEFDQKLRQHTSTGPALTGGDVDADWEDAESVGDEAPGGDNPTPDQDIVDEIGRAIGIEYDDDQELQGGDELAERDRHRWELDPASKDDFEDE